MKLSEYLKQNGMTTKDYFEMRKRKEEGKTSLSDYQRKLYQEIKNTDLSDIVKDLSSNNFLDQETLTYYNDRVSQVADKVSRLTMGDAESNKSFLDNLKTLQDGIGKASEYYSAFKDENDYKAQLKAIEQNKKWASADTKTLKTELDDLENNYKSYVDIKTKRDSLYHTIVSGYMRAGYGKEKAEKVAASDGRIAKYDKELSQYGDMSGVEKNLSDKKQFYNNAKRIQDGIALRDNALNAEDFEEYSLKGKNLDSDTGVFIFNNYLGENEIEYWRKKRQKSIEKAKKLDPDFDENSLELGNERETLAANMNDEEVSIYNYYLAKFGEDKAEEFLKSIQESVLIRGNEKAMESIEGKWGLELTFAAAAGLENWVLGEKSLFNNEGEYAPQTSMQILSSMAREDISNKYGVVGQSAYDLVNTTANMMPSILVSTMTGNIAGGLGAGVKAAQTIGKLAGVATLGSSAAGNGYQEMLNLGYDKGQAQAYGTLVGLSEAGLEYALGGISSLGGKFSGGITNTIVNKLISNVDNAIAKVAIGAGGKLVGSMVSEFGEEYLQEILDPVFKNITLHTDEDIKLYTPEALYSGILGALSAGLLEGGSTISGEVSTYKQGKAVKDSGQLSNLKKFGTSFSADTVAYKIASQVNENTDAYTIGQLLHEAGADSLSEANIAEITKSLERKNISPEHAQTIAKWLNKAVEGGNFTKSQIKALENPDIAQTFKDVIINQNSTVNQRMQSYTDILQNIATEKETQKAAKVKAKADKKANKNTQAAEESKSTPFIPYSNEEIAKRQATGEDLNLLGDNSSPETKIPSESKFEVNVDGKTINLKSGEEVKIAEIASIDNGKMKLKLDNEETVDATDIKYATEDEAQVYTAMLDMGVNAAVANSLVKNYNPSDNISGEIYAKGIKEAYKYGSYGFPISEISKKGFAADLSEAQRTHAYNLGKADTAAKVEKAQKEVEKVVSGKGGIEGKVYFKGDELALKAVQRESLKRIGVLSEVLGVDIHIFESYAQGNKRLFKDTDGKVKSAPNGFYRDGKIYIDLNAGKDGQGVMIYTVAHELTHWIKDWSPAKFKILADFLMEQYGKVGQSVEDLVQAQIVKAKKNNREIDYDTAYEEVVADSMESMLSDDNVLEKIFELKAKDESIVKKIGEFFAKIIDSFKKLMQQYEPDSTEGKIVANMHDSFSKLQDLFAEALVDASNNYQANEGQKNTTSEGDVKMQIREDFYTQLDNWDGKTVGFSFVVGTTSEALKQAKIPEKQIRWDASKIKTLLDKHIGMTIETIREIPELLENPVVVIDSKKDENSKIVMGDLHDKNEKLVTVVLLLTPTSKKGNQLDVIKVSSAQGRGHIESLFKNADGSSVPVRYVDKKRIQNWLNVNRLRLPLHSFNLDSNDSISQTSKKSQEKLSDRDTLGNTLTEAQQSYFAESKVRDENGNLKVMYHGSPNADFTIFKSGTYFTEHKWYADVYQNQGASSLSYKKTANKPDTYAVYLNIKKPFDTRNKTERDIFYNEYYQQWGTGTDLMESGLPDWLDGQDLQEFLEEKGYDYDGLILDEGATGGYGEEVTSRGLSYVVFSPEQVKSVENKTPTDNPDYRFSMRENVEETKDLVAVHNLSEEKLLKSLELGGLPMPSIAIIRAREGHTDFGKISLVFNKETIDPQFISKNKVFSGDAWTPTYPRIEHKVNDKEQKKIANRINNLVPEEVLRGLGGLHIDSYNLEQDLNRHNGNLVEMFRYNTALKYAFLTENGVQLELPNKFKPLGRYSNRDNDVIIRVAENVSEEKLRGITGGYTNEQIYEVEPEIRKAVNGYLQEKYKKLPPKALAKLISEDTMSIGQMFDLAIDALNYLTDGIKQEVDYYAARDLIDETIDAKKYEAWIKELFANIVEKEGIRNNKDMFTPSGNRRSFEALHYEHNLENVIKAMKEEGTKGIGTFGRGNIFGASTTEFQTITDIKDAANARMQNIPQEEYEAIKKGFSDRFFELAYSLPIHKDSFTATDSAANMLIEAVSKFKTKSGMANYIRKESQGWANYSDYVVDDLIELVNDIRNMPVGYFEAKPQRAVEFNEVATAIIPDNSSDELKAKLTDNGIKFVEYDDGSEKSRLETLNSLEDVKFSDRDPDAAENIEKINKQLAKENVKLIEDVKYLKELVKLQGKETHGKVLKKSTVELVAKRLMTYSSAKGDVSELVSHLTDVYSYIAQGEDVSWEGIQEKSQAAVDWLMYHENHKPIRDELATEILSDLRRKRVALDPIQKQEVANYYDSYNTFRKKNMGRIIITDSGIPLDTQWQEWVELYPSYFDKETNSADQPIMLMSIIDNLQNTFEGSDYYYYPKEMIAQDLMTKVYEGYWDVSALHTVADAKQKEINLLKAKHRQQMDDVKKSHEESDTKLRQEHKEKIAQLRTQYREREEAKVKKVAEYYQKSRKEAVDRVKETREKRDAITKLQKLVLDTAKWVSYPKKDDIKCPDIIRAPYSEFLSSIDLSSKRLLNGGEPTQNDLRVASAMDSLAKAIEKKLGTQNPNVDTDKVLDTGYLDLPVHFVENLKELAENLKMRMVTDGHIVNSMTSEEVKALSKFIKTLNHSIKEMSTLYSNMRFARVEQLGNDTMLFLKDLGEAKQTNSITDFVTWDNALPYYTFKRFGVAGESVFEELMDAQDKLASLADEIFKFKEKTWTNKEASEWSKDTHTIKLPSGRELTLTSADAMSIYCLSRREQGRQHLLGGGVRVLGIEKNGKKANDSRSLLNQQDILAISSSLTERQRKVAEAVQEYMSTVCSEWGNEISMKRFLTKEFTEKFYFPIESNDENLDTKDPKAQQSDLYRLLNISATKPLTKGANNEVIIRNVFDVFTGHSSDMAKLNAYGMALLDYMKWINYREKTVNDDGQISVSGVRKSMERAYGSEAKKYIIGLIKDINGRANDGGDHPFLMKMTRTAKTTMVGANLRVAALQFTAYPRAAMVLSNRSLALGLTKVPQIEKAKKYCGIALWKSFGFYDTNISRSIEDQIKGTTNLRQKLIELSLKGAEWGDSITWGCLWNACEYEVAKTKQYKVGSEEFNQAVGKKLREVVYATQVVDSVLTRSQMMRNKSGLTQSASAFMSEPTLSANILMDAAFQFNLEKRRTGSAKLAWQKTGKHIGKAVAVYSIGQIITALAEAIQDAYRDDDDEEFMAKFGEAFKENAISDLNPFNKIPIIADVSDLIMSWFGIGFSSSNSLYLQAVSEANNAFETWQKVMNGEGGKTVYSGIYSTTKLISYITGVSASGLMREVVTLWNNTAGAADPYLKIRTYESSATDKNIAEYKFDKGDTASVKTTVSKMIEDKVKSGKTEKEAKSAVRSSFTSTYKSEYIAAVKAKDYDEMNRIRKFLYATGLYGTLSELDETLKKWRTGE